MSERKFSSIGSGGAGCRPTGESGAGGVTYYTPAATQEMAREQAAIAMSAHEPILPLSPLEVALARAEHAIRTLLQWTPKDTTEGRSARIDAYAAYRAVQEARGYPMPKRFKLP